MSARWRGGMCTQLIPEWAESKCARVEGGVCVHVDYFGPARALVQRGVRACMCAQAALPLFLDFCYSQVLMGRFRAK